MEFDRSRDETLLKFKVDEAEQNCQHKLQVAAFFTNCLSPPQYPRFNTTDFFRATTPAPMFSPMCFYIPPQHHRVISPSPTSNENTIPTIEETSYWRDSIRKYWVTFFFVTTNYISLVSGIADNYFLFDDYFFCFLPEDRLKQIEKTLMNYRWRVWKESWKFRIPTIYNFAVTYPWILLFS